MARVKLDIPNSKFFSTEIAVRITDINYGNHVGNDAIVSIIHEARVRWLNVHSLSELNIGAASIIMADLALEYKAESFYGDILNISISVGEISKISFELYYEISTIRNEKNILVAKAKTGIVCFDYIARKVASIPESFLKLLQATNF